MPATARHQHDSFSAAHLPATRASTLRVANVLITAIVGSMMSRMRAIFPAHSPPPRRPALGVLRGAEDGQRDPDQIVEVGAVAWTRYAPQRRADHLLGAGLALDPVIRRPCVPQATCAPGAGEQAERREGVIDLEEGQSATGGRAAADDGRRRPSRFALSR